MKNIKIYLLILTAFITSCSSDTNNNVTLTRQGLLGKWYLKGGTINNGTFQNYNHECSTDKDFQEFFDTGIITFNGYDADCNLVEVEGSNWTLNGNVLIISSLESEPFFFEDEFVVENFSSTMMILKQEGINEETGNSEVVRTYLTRE